MTDQEKVQFQGQQLSQQQSSVGQSPVDAFDLKICTYYRNSVRRQMRDCARIMFTESLKKLAPVPGQGNGSECQNKIVVQLL